AVFFSLPSEERRPCLSIGGDPAHDHRRRDIKHDHVIRMVRDDRADLPRADRIRPVLDQAANNGVFSLSAHSHALTPCAPGFTGGVLLQRVPMSSGARPQRQELAPTGPRMVRCWTIVPTGYVTSGTVVVNASRPAVTIGWGPDTDEADVDPSVVAAL